MYNRQRRKEEAYLYKALKLSGSLQIGEEEKSEQIRKIMEISKVDWLTGKKRERTDFTAFLIRQIPFIGWKMWSIQALVMISAVVFFYGTGRRNCGCNMAVGGKKTCVSGRSTGNCHGNDRDSLCDAVFPIPDV